jgi:hypothetical protein
MDTKTRVKKAARRIAIATDTVLVKAGKAAELRQRDRAVQAALKKTGKIAGIAATTAALVVAARAAIRARRRPAPAPAPTATP